MSLLHSPENNRVLTKDEALTKKDEASLWEGEAGPGPGQGTAQDAERVQCGVQDETQGSDEHEGLAQLQGP